MSDAVETDTPVGAYIKALGLTEMPTLVAWADSAELWRIVDDHFVIVECTKHEHFGHEALAAVTIPPAWVCFHAVYNPVAGWEGFHYGPDEVPA